MQVRHRLGILLITILTFFPLVGTGQSLLNQNQPKPAASDSAKKAVKPIPLNNINNASTEAFTLFSKLGEQVMGKSVRENFTTRTESIVNRTNKFFMDTVGIQMEALNFREIEIIGNSIRILNLDISNLQGTINDKLNALQEGESSLKQNKQRWSLSLKENRANETPDAIIRRIENVISRNDSVSRLIQQDIDFLLTQSDRLTSEEIRLDQFKTELAVYGKINSSNIFKRDMAPVWSMFSSTDSINVSAQWQLFSSNFANDSSILVNEFIQRLILVLCIFVFLVILVSWLKATMKDPQIKVRKVKLGLYVNEIFQKPLEVSLLLGLYIIWLIIPEMPASYSSLLAIISVYAILRLAMDIMPHGYKGFMIGFSIAYILLKFYNLFYDQVIFSRLMLVVAQIIALVFLIRFIQARRKLYSKKRTTFNVVLSSLAVIYLIFISIAFLGNIAGMVSFSGFLSSGVIKSGFLIITTYVGFHISTALFYLVLNSKLFTSSRIIKKQAGYIFEKLYKLLKLFFIVSWFYIALDHFTVREVVSEWGNSVLRSEFSIGQASFSLINIILFFFVIWLSIWISRIIRHVLTEEVFTRVKVERGMPGTIIMLVRITVVSIGFLLAAAAAGMQLSNLTIIIGAFSVGIGFGLQNIFNNLVSGLILVFERPIKEGDIVELNTLLGTVKKIGIRSSIVRTFSGAEVIVPNGELISNELINWTLSDQFRRAEIIVGVAYGTDPEAITKLLLQVALDNKRVNEHPPPQAFFMDFGESSLDFRLLAWIDQEYRFEVESELRIEINKRLKKGGYEIPFPQRDLHIRSADPEAGKHLKGEK